MNYSDATGSYPCQCPECRPVHGQSLTVEPPHQSPPRLEPLAAPPPLMPPPHLHVGILGPEPRQERAMVSTREMWSLVKRRVQWIEEQYQAMERDHARDEGRGESRPLFSYIKEYALIKLMRAAYAVLEELSELIPA